MKYNTISQHELDKALDYFTRLVGQEAIVEIKKFQPKRSNQQNRYYHVCINFFSMGTGYTKDETTQLIKRLVCPDVFVYKKRGTEFVRSSADLDLAEMTRVIDKFREFSAGHGYPIPAASDPDFLIWVENESEKQQAYL